MDLPRSKARDEIIEVLVLAVPAQEKPLPAAEMDNRKFPAIDASALQHQRFVMLTDAQYMQRQLMNLVTENKLAVHTAAIVKSLEAQIEMVKAGIGMSLVPSGIERFCNKGREKEVTFYSFRQELPKREVVVMWRKDRTLSKVTEEMLGWNDYRSIVIREAGFYTSDQ